MKKSNISLLVLAAVLSFSCTVQQNNLPQSTPQEQNAPNSEIRMDRFADIEVLKYQVPGWNNLTLKEKEYVYYLSQAGYSGRDMTWDQNYKHNLKIRRALENIYQNFSGNKNTEEWRNFEIYLKRVWFANGIHHHYSNEKMKPLFSKTYFEQLLQNTNTSLDKTVTDILFNTIDSKKVNLDLSKGLLRGSVVNYYDDGITSEEAERYYAQMKSPDPNRALSAGLNSKLVRENAKITEKIYKSGGMYGPAIDQIIYWLEKARTVAENQKQAESLALLIQYYKTGSLKTWDDYNVAWVSATDGNIDYINGFIEVYNDPMGRKGSYESMVQI